MATFYVPTAEFQAQRLVFRVREQAVLLAGSRHGTVHRQTVL